MKIVALHTDFRLYWPARLNQLSENLKKRGDELFIIEISGKGSPYSFASKSDKIPLNWNYLFPEEAMEDISPVLAKKKIFQELNLISPDIILAGAIAFPSGAAAVDWAKRNNKAVVIFDDSKLDDVPRSFLVNQVKKIIYSNVDAILCPAEDWLNTFKYWGFKEDAVFYGEDVVDNSFWAEKGINGESFLPDKFILSVGRQIKRKNFDTIIKSFIAFHEQVPNSELELVLVGEGPERKKLEDIANGSIKNKIHFLPFQSPENLRKIYHQACFFILASYSEQWGLVVNEAMATGLPVVVSKQLGCASSLVQDKKNGFIVNAYSSQDFVTVYHKINNLKEKELIQMSEKSTEIISNWDLNRFSLGAMNAIDYAFQNQKNQKNLLNLFLLKKWKGRYNQI